MLANVQNVSYKLLCAAVVIRILFLMPLFGADSRFFGSRTWTDTSGREIEAEYVSATKYDVKIRRESDGRVFTILVTTLSKKDQNYIELRRSIEEAEQPKRVKQQGTDPFAGNHKPPIRGNVQVAEHVPSVPISGELVADRSKIPSLSYEELGGGYRSDTSNLVNILVWWGDALEQNIMPHGDRQRSIKRISEDVEQYRGDYSNSRNHIHMIMRKYSEKRLNGYVIECKIDSFPNKEILVEKSSGWIGAVVLYGFYEQDSSGQLRRVGGRYATLVELKDQSVIQNLLGSQYELRMRGEPMENEILPSSIVSTLESHRREGCFEVVNATVGPEQFIPEGQIAIIEGVNSFRLSKLSSKE